jgi:dTDP-4-amino-4,6-dideoxygalactose transaminase
MTSRLALLGGTPIRTAPFRTWPVIDERDEKLLLDALHSGTWSRWDGAYTRRFEEEFSRYTGAGYTLAVSSGTGALEVAMRAIGLRAGDEVIAPAYCFTAPIAAILSVGAIPVLVDVSPDSFCLDPAATEEAINDRTRAILLLHLGGVPCDTDRFSVLASQHNLLIIEDAALALGTTVKDRQVGTLADAGIFSFQAEKNLACGEGGAVVTNDTGTWQRAAEVHEYWKGHLVPHTGWSTRALSYRISELLSALLISQLARVEEQSEKRAHHGALLDTRLRAIPGLRPITGPTDLVRNTRSLYMLDYDAAVFGGVPKERIIKALNAEGIPAVGGYPRPIYENPIFSRDDSGYSQLPMDPSRLTPEPCPVTESLCRERAIWLRQQLLLCDEWEVGQIADAFEKVYEHRAQLA